LQKDPTWSRLGVISREKEKLMRLRTPQGKEIEATIITDKGKVKVIATMSTGHPGAKTLEELEKCEIISATEQERGLLREGGFRMKGLAS
jgi:hypothetical protein